MRGECVRQRGNAKVGGFALSAASYCHACEHITRGSQADSCTHCLHARIIGLAGVNLVCTLTVLSKISPISLCSHPDPHPNSNREVHRSLTWHSSKSESALERFKPVAVVMLQSDSRRTLFALVAARRQGEIYKRWNASYMTFGTFRH